MPIVPGVLSRNTRYSASSSQLSFRLTVYPSPQFLQLTEGFIMSPLPHLAAKGIRLSMAPSLHPHYQTSSLIRATPPSCCLRPFSCVRSYRTYLFQGISPRASRTSPVSIVSLLPCRHHYPAGVIYSLSQSEIAHAVFAEY